jgi:hypothetical protein
MARSAYGTRQFAGWLSVGVGAAALGAGTAIAAGAGDMTSGQRTSWSLALLLSGGTLGGAGVGTLLVPSELEMSYRATFGADAFAPPVSVGFAPLPGGGAVSLRGNF